MRKLSWALLVFVPTLMVPTSGQDAPPSPEMATSIRKVTVFLDRAKVLRVGEVRLPKGERRIEIRDLPVLLDDSSIRAAAGGARIRSTEIQRYSITREKISQEEVKKLQGEIRTAETEIRKLDDQLLGLTAEWDFLQSLKTAKAAEVTDGVMREKMKTMDLEEFAAFLRKALQESAGRLSEVRSRRAEKDAEREALVRDLARRRSSQVLERKAVTIVVDGEAEGPTEVTLSYLVPAALWTPIYDLRTDPKIGAEALELEYAAQVVQTTGEDWSGVELELSTALPMRSNSIPPLSPIDVSKGVDPSSQQAVYQVWKQEFGGNLQHQKILGRSCNAARGYDEQQLTQNDLLLDRMAGQIERIMFATIHQQVATYNFRLPRRESIPSDGALHKIVLSESKLPARFERILVPKSGPYAYVKATLRNDKEFPLLPGTVNLFRGDDHSGVSTIEAIAPNESFELSAGIDDGIKAIRKLEEKQGDKGGGLFGSAGKILYRFSIRVTNLSAEKRSVTVVDQIPISRDTDVEVMVTEATTKYASLDKEGRIEWKLELAAGETKEIILDYRIYHPAGRALPGIE